MACAYVNIIKGRQKGKGGVDLGEDKEKEGCHKIRINQGDEIITLDSSCFQRKPFIDYIKNGW